MDLVLTDWDTQYKIIYNHNDHNLFIILERLKHENKKIVFTNGCFDLLHVGHINLLQTARGFGDYLIVGLNTNHSISKIKEDNRPIINDIQRSQLLSSLTCVDLIVMFDEVTPASLIVKIKPNVLVKGEDWKGKDITGRQYVEYNGGVVKFVESQWDISTTSIINKILKTC